MVKQIRLREKPKDKPRVKMTLSGAMTLGEMIPHDQMHEISKYCEIRWDHIGSTRWTELCVKLERYVPAPKTLSLDKNRKWELVSAIQKSIRRADKQACLRLISAVDEMPKEYGYFWKRLCVTACEDIGLADDELAMFVIACSTVFLPSKTGALNYGLFCFLAEQMCELPQRSRIYCSVAVIDDVASKFGLPAITTKDKSILAAITLQKSLVRQGTLPWTEWQRKNNWRAEGMLQYLGIAFPAINSQVNTPILTCTNIQSLPSYAYDMHTRAGLAVLKRLAGGAEGADAIYYLLKRYHVKTAHIALGWALFFVEGGLITGEIAHKEVSDFEQRAVAHRFSLPVEAWYELRSLTRDLVECGVVDRERSRITFELYERPKSESGSLFDPAMD